MGNDSCLENSDNEKIKPTTSATLNDDNTDICYCDIKKQKQVEVRLRKQGQDKNKLKQQGADSDGA